MSRLVQQLSAIKVGIKSIVKETCRLSFQLQKDRICEYSMFRQAITLA